MTESRTQISFDGNLKLNFSYDMSIESAYVITIDGHTDSERLSARCLESCAQHNLPAQRWSAFDGTKGSIRTPQHLQKKEYLKWLKVTDHYLSASEVACVLSHVSLWAHCIEIDKPIVILEHDAVIVSPILNHGVYGCMIYLGCREQKNLGWPVLPTPPHATNGPNYHFICRAHAYSIDPAVAKLLLSYVIKKGICESLDLMIRADIFPIVQMGLLAYDDPDGISTIQHRKKDPFGKER